MTHARDHAALLERNRHMLTSLEGFVPEGFDPAEKLVFSDRPDFNRTGFMVAQASLDYAVILLETGRDAQLANDIIEKCLEYQDLRDPDSPTYGNFFWYTQWTEVRDPNAVTFMTPHLVRIWRNHRDKLRDDVARTLEARFPLILNGLMKQPWCHWAYTNIFLLTTAGRLMVATLLGDDAALGETRRQWNEWLEKTSEHGIPEFNSPTYSAVDLHALLQLRNAAPDDSFKAEVERALEYYFLEFFLNYHPEIGLLTGAMSRAYLNEQHTDLRPQEPVALLCHHQLGTPLEEAGHRALALAFSDYLAPKWIRQLAFKKDYPLTIDATSSGKRGYYVRRNFLKRTYTVGTFSNSYYGILQTAVFVAYDAPAERKNLFTRSTPELGTCYADQVADSVLAAFCYNFADDRHRYGRIGKETYLANLCLNLGRADDLTDVLIAGEPWDGKTTMFSSETPVVFRVGPIVVGVVPMVGAVSVDGDPVALVADDEGVRLEIRIYDGDAPAETAFPRAQAGFYLRVAEEMVDLSKVVIESTFDADTWRLSATDGDRELAVCAPLSAENVFADAPKVGRNHPEPGTVLHSPYAALRIGEFTEIVRGRQTGFGSPTP